MKKVLLILALILLPTFVHADTLISNGLVGYWTFDGKDMVNGVAIDRSGQGNNGNLINIATSTFYTVGKVGQGLKFDGSSIVTIRDNASLRPTALSIAFWQKVPNLSDERVLDKTVSDYIVRRKEVMEFITTQGCDTFFDSSVSKIVLNTWQHWVITAGSSGCKWYLNGNLDTSTVTAYTGGVGSSDLTISSASSLLTGVLLDDMRIYNRILSATEVLQLYNNSKVNFITPPSVSSGLVGYWNFDGKTIVNGHINDNSGKGNTGYPFSISTSTFYTGGKIGQGIKLDGVDDYVKITQTSGLPVYGTAGYSVSFWVRGASGQTNMCIYCEANTGDDNPFFRIITGNSDTSKLQINIRNTAGSGLTSSETTGTVFDNKWHHVVWTDNNGTGIVYIDGVLNTNISYTPSATSLNDSSIGALIRSSVSSFFKGNVDEVRTYNRVLSATEITQLYNNGKVALLTPSSVTGLDAWWTFDGKDLIGRVLDRSGNGRDAYLTSTQGTTTAPGRIGQAINYSGISGTGTVITPSISTGTTFTWASWIWIPSGTVSSYANIFASNAGSGIYTRTDKIDYYTGADNFSTTAITRNTWHHVAVVNNAGTVTFYLDGNPDGSFTSASTAFFIQGMGCDGGTGAECFKGLNDDVRYYTRILSATEIRQLYNSGINIINK